MEKITLTKESETLYIPLFGKAEMSRSGLFLTDKRAEEIVSRIDYDFTRNKSSVFLSIYMSIRAAILDDYANRFIAEHPDGVVLHLGCGLDSRIDRIAQRPRLWVDLDLPDVIAVRKQFFEEDEGYRMISSSVTDLAWLEQIENSDCPALIIAEGLTMYLTEEENKALFLAFKNKFCRSDYVFDAYSLSAVKISKRKNPVNKMGATIRWGLDDPGLAEEYGQGISHIETTYFTGKQWSNQLTGVTRFLFRVLYGNKFADSLYRIYLFRIQNS